MYAFGLLSWEVLSQQKPFADIKNEGLLCVTIHQNGRPDLSELPEGIPVTIIEMITSCWSKKRSDRKSAAECFTIINECLEVIFTKYDIFMSHSGSYRKDLMNNIVYIFTQAGLRVRWNSKGALSVNKLTLTQSSVYQSYIASKNGLTASSISRSNTTNIYIPTHLNTIGTSIDRTASSQSTTFMQIQQDMFSCVMFVACVDSSYQNSTECLRELREARGLTPSLPIYTLLLEPNPLQWMNDELIDLCELRKGGLYLDISSISKKVSDPKWGEDDDDDDNAYSELITELQKILHPIISFAHCEKEEEKSINLNKSQLSECYSDEGSISNPMDNINHLVLQEYQNENQGHIDKNRNENESNSDH
jgi:hypothetical protein